MISQNKHLLTDEEIREYIQNSFASFSRGTKGDRLLSGVMAIWVSAPFIFLLNLAGGRHLPGPWDAILLVSLLILTTIWNVVSALFWKPPSSEAFQPPIAETLLPRLHHTEAWASLWFGGELLLFSFLGLEFSVLAWNAFGSWGVLNLIPLGIYGLLYPILFFRRRWLLCFGVGFEAKMLTPLWVLALLMMLLSTLAPLLRSTAVDLRFWVLSGVASVFYALTCLAVGTAFRFFEVAHIHFQAYREITNKHLDVRSTR